MKYVFTKNLPAVCFLFFIAVCFQHVHAQTTLPAVSSGKLQRISQFNSAYVTPRNIDVWLPRGYPDSGKYDVLYMHDGQMLFDSLTTWNRQAWDADDISSALMASGKLRNFIIVGIWSDSKTRHQDYFPQKPFDLMLNKTERDTVSSQLQRAGRTAVAFNPRSDKYLKFLVEELKPMIDKNFAVYTVPNHTFIAGSSMGGLISLYAICEYPDVFGGAACLSTHWPGSFTLQNNPFPLAMKLYLQMKLPNPKQHQIYFDCGNKTLDALYPPIQKEVDEVMREAGYGVSSWHTSYIDGADHSERAWKSRLSDPLIFLLSK